MEGELNQMRRKLDETKKKLEIALKEIKVLKEEKLDTYHKGYQQGAFDEKMSWVNQDHEE